jgi:hypothetical protein
MWSTERPSGDISEGDAGDVLKPPLPLTNDSDGNDDGALDDVELGSARCSADDVGDGDDPLVVVLISCVVLANLSFFTRWVAADDDTLDDEESGDDVVVAVPRASGPGDDVGDGTDDDDDEWMSLPPAAVAIDSADWPRGL